MCANPPCSLSRYSSAKEEILIRKAPPVPYVQENQLQEHMRPTQTLCAIRFYSPSSNSKENSQEKTVEILILHAIELLPLWIPCIELCSPMLSLTLSQLLCEYPSQM
ncbi:hypothetical protein M758_3G060000 [Ceratodon purpureus]|nr:hypothetical protein M758_3G060000 [Ceratodon purpureus]